MSEKVKSKRGRKHFADRSRVKRHIRVYVEGWRIDALGGDDAAEAWVKEKVNEATSKT